MGIIRKPPALGRTGASEDVRIWHDEHPEDNSETDPTQPASQRAGKFKPHPKHLRSLAEANSAFIKAINCPGPAGEAAQLQALHFQRHSCDARKFVEAMSAESLSWRRPR